jgi:hypothetical protein
MILGIDNGLDGGIVALSPLAGLSPIAKFIMPTMMVWHPTVTKTSKDKITGKVTKTKGKHIREVNSRALIALLDSIEGNRDEITVYFEQCPMHADKALTMRSMAMSAGKIIAILEAKSFKVVRIMSHDWHPAILGKFPKGESKATALAKATALWPGESWLPSDIHSTPHNGMIDAALIAEYGRQLQYPPAIPTVPASKDTELPWSFAPLPPVTKTSRP